jgi:hypothetical protein
MGRRYIIRATDSVVKQNINKYIPLLTKNINHFIFMCITFNKKLSLKGIEKIELLYSLRTMFYFPTNVRNREILEFNL